MQTLLDFFLEAAEGRFPASDGGLTVVPCPSIGQRAVVAFTGHAVIAADVDEAEARARGADGFGGAHQPKVLTWLAGHNGIVGVHDVMLFARGIGGPSALAVRNDLDDHDRVRYARTIRSDVRVLGDDRGLVTLGHGLGGRLELSIEARADLLGQGVGRGLIADALTAVPVGEPVFAAVSPGNARSLRAFLAAGFVPIGSETIILGGPAGGAAA